MKKKIAILCAAALLVASLGWAWSHRRLIEKNYYGWRVQRRPRSS